MTAAAARYAALDRLPPGLYRPVVACIHGHLAARAEAVHALWDALLGGSLPPAAALPWPEPAYRDALLDNLARERLPALCQGERGVTEALLLDVLELVDEMDRLRDRMALLGAQLRGLGEEELDVARGECAGGCDGLGRGAPRWRRPRVSDATRAEMRAEAARLMTTFAGARVRARMADRWRGRVAVWEEVKGLLEALRRITRRGWTLDLGSLAVHQWREMHRVHELLAQIPAVRAWVERLGRLRAIDDPAQPTALERALGAIRRAREEERVTATATGAVETRGVERTGELGRMLPSEAAMLAHPTLRGLWHARRAEAALLGYHAAGVYTERVRVTADFDEEGVDPKPRAAAGPVILCLDTSGSMRGTPGDVAKAVALHAACVAHEESRRCVLYNFSGPGQVDEVELGNGLEGLTALVEFLARSFDGGTDLVAPLERAAARVEREDWRRADVVVVSDGQFDPSPACAEAVQGARARRGTRFLGVLVGTAPPDAMAALCDEVVAFETWAQAMAPG